MIELFENSMKMPQRQSSKGNQLKWEDAGIWYKADYFGYEGLSEYVVSHLLLHSSLEESEFVLYELEEIKYKKNKFNGAKSNDFTSKNWQIITLERLFKNKYGKSLYEAVWHLQGIKERYEFLSDQVKTMTGLENFDKYLNKLLTIDAIFFNEDRHMHNIAVMMNSNQEFDYCKIFDNGACLLSDTKMEYPLEEDIYSLMRECHAKTISRDFDEQLDASEEISGINIRFSFTKKDIQKILNKCDIYSKEVRYRVETILYSQMKKYQYLFA